MMADFDPASLSKTALFALADTLIVYASEPGGKPDMPYVLLDSAGRIFGFNGHVDLGTGIRTALAQIIAEELDVAPGAVAVILGDTARTPDQGATIASETIQKSAVPLRSAAAQARRYLMERAAAALAAPMGSLTAADGVFSTAAHNRTISYAELLIGVQARLPLDPTTPTKDPSAYRIVGGSTQRVDIPSKATGELIYVHDMRIPDMLHGRVVRPPYAGVDAGDFVGASLLSVDEASIASIPGVVAVVVIGDFVGVVAEREEQAVAAAKALKIEWRYTGALPDLKDLAATLPGHPSAPRVVHDVGDVEAARAGAATLLDRTYVWPYQMHASIGPSCALADYREDRVRIWSGTQNPHPLRNDLALLLDLPADRIDIVRMEAAGCYGRNCADDVAADAALLSRAVNAPVRVQLSREQEHLWEPKGTGQLMQARGALDADGAPIAYDYSSWYPSNGAPTLALLLTGRIPAIPEVWEMGDRTSVAPYDYPNQRVTIHDMAPIVRASWLRGVSALPSSFAHESWIDEAAAMAGVDPVEYRLRFLTDARGVAVIQATAERAGWTAHTRPQTLEASPDAFHGRGFAYALYVHGKFPGSAAAWAAWVAEVEVNRKTGEVKVTKVTVGHDAGLMINPAGVQHQIHGNVIQATSRALMEQVTFDSAGTAVSEWGGYPIITFPDIPKIDVLMLPRPDQPPLGAGESASVPSAAAIANALYDATGVRFREPPFTPEKVRAALQAAGLLTGPPTATAAPKRRRELWSKLVQIATGLAALMVTVSPWSPAIAPRAGPRPGLYSEATLERGRVLAAVGDCAVCHTVPGHAVNSGGLALETPFGVVFSTNLTPDPETGIGAWSYDAFRRAMRHGVSRDGHRLYPAFPYTAFAKVSDDDMEALYGYLMAQKPIRSAPPRSQLAFPFSVRPLMAGWNALFHRPSPWTDDPRRSADWNRGGYLVEGLGHCAACHSPRNLMGAERKGRDHLGGGVVDGWDAPALTSLSRSPAPWRADDFYAYLRNGYAPHHGAAAGPMAPVVDEMRALPDEDIRAIATYLASFGDQAVTVDRQRATVAQLEGKAQALAPLIQTPGASLYRGACAACHDANVADPFAIQLSLATSGGVHAAKPDNMIRVILDGANGELARLHGAMPGFRDSLSDAQISELMRYARRRFASDQPAWTDLDATISRVRKASSPQGRH